MKKLLSFSTLIVLILLLYSERFLNKSYHSASDIKEKESIIGDSDDPGGAIAWRYNMLKGNKPYLDPFARQRAIDHTKRKLFKASPNILNSVSSWSALGPGNIGGRIRSILVRPSNSNTILAGSVAGGVWKSTDGGSSWFPTMDADNPLAIGCMANNEDTVYAGTGEGWFNIDAVYGGGIYKSTDFGDSWTLLSSTSGQLKFKSVMQLAFDPDGNIYAVTRAYDYEDGKGTFTYDGGLFKSTDGGSSWNKIDSISQIVGDDVIPISSSVILYATEPTGSSARGIYKTTDGGSNWNLINNGIPTPTGFNRIAFAHDPNNINTIYAAFESNGIYKSTDAGDSWTNIRSSTDYLGGQGWYDNVIAVDPHNSNDIYAGGVDMIKSTDGGSNWSFVTDVYNQYGGGKPYIHPDEHAIAFDQSTAGIIYNGNDGGIYKTTDSGASWGNLNNNLAITQFYGGAVYPTGSTYYGGTQDNGHLKYSGSGTDWNMVVGGDGGYAGVDQTNSQVAYEEYVYLQMYKTTDGGVNWSSCIKGLGQAGNPSYSEFISPFSLNPENSSVLIAGATAVYVSTNSAGNWKRSVNSIVSGQFVSAVTIVNSSSPYLGFAGAEDGTIHKCTSLTGSGDTWTDITPPSNNGAWVRRIVVDLNNKQNIYACYSGYNDDGVIPTKHVWNSTDQGSNWTDISGDLPDVPVHSLVIDPNNSQTLYIGTETGVYQTTNGGTNWVNVSTSGIAAYAPVDELVLQTGTNKLFAYTHGRSVFVTTLEQSVTAKLKIFLEGPYTGSSAMSTALNPYLPTSDPYSLGENVGSIPSTDIVDWVEVQLRSDTTTVVATRAAFIKSDGSIVDLDGTSDVNFTGVSDGNYYIVIKHRNHLAVMSAVTVALSGSISTLYDFTTGSSKFYNGSSGAKDLGSGVWGMISGDGNGNGQVQNNDSETIWKPDNGTSGYKNSDFNLNGQVQNNDNENYWKPNNGRGSQVP